MIALLRVIIRVADSVNEKVGTAASWLTSLLVLTVCANVIARYGFRVSNVAAQELEWHLFGTLFLLGAAYTLKHDRHVRVDVIYARLSAKYKAAVDLVGATLLLLPFSVIIIWTSKDYVRNSFRLQEGSRDGGLPALYVLKAMITIGFVLVVIQGLAVVSRSLLILLRQQTTNEATE